MRCFGEEFMFRAERIMMHQDGHPHLRYAPAAGPRPPANRIPPSSGSASLAGPRVPEILLSSVVTEACNG